MKKFEVNRILIPIDFSDTALLALDHATFMAKLFNAEVILLHVVETLTFTTVVSDSYPGVEMEKTAQKTVAQQLESLAKENFEKQGLSYKTKVAVGRIYVEIVKIAKEVNADVIIMGTHGVTGVKEFFIGSNAYRVVSESSCPVITVQSHAKEIGFKNIVLPIDDSITSRQKVNHAIEIAKRYGATISIAGLVTDDDPLSMGKFEVKINQVEDFIRKHEVPFTAKIIKGENVAKMTLNYAYEINADLIIIMSEQDPDLTGLFMGPFAQQLVNHSKIPVMTVHPDEKLAQSYTFPYWT